MFQSGRAFQARPVFSCFPPAHPKRFTRRPPLPGCSSLRGSSASMYSHGCRPLGCSASAVDLQGLASGERLFDLCLSNLVLPHARCDSPLDGLYLPTPYRLRCRHLFVSLRSLPRFVCSGTVRLVFGFAVRFLIADWICSAPRFHFRPLHWARLHGNSCARQLRVFCFSVSSQKIFGNNAEIFCAPPEMQTLALGAVPTRF